MVRGHLPYVGNTSMEVRVDTYREALDGTRTMINRAYVVMVALDEEGKTGNFCSIFIPYNVGMEKINLLQ